MTTDNKFKILNVDHNIGQQAINVQCLLEANNDISFENIIESFYLLLGKNTQQRDLSLNDTSDQSETISSSQFYIFPSKVAHKKINEYSAIVDLEFEVRRNLKDINEVKICNQLFCDTGDNILAELTTLGQKAFRLRDECIEPTLFFFRYFLIFATIASILGSCYLIFTGCVEMSHIFTLSNEEHHDFRLPIIQAIDSFLFATVLMIFGLGIYNLFISQIEVNKSDTDIHWLKVKSLDDLKSYLTKTVILIMIITFFENVIEADMIKSSVDMIYFTGSIALIALSVFLLHIHISIGHEEKTK